MTGKKAMRVTDYIGHIIEAIARIENYVKGLDQTSFIENSLVQDAVIRNIEIIGEAANNIKEADAAFWENTLIYGSIRLIKCEISGSRLLCRELHYTLEHGAK